MNPLSNYPGVRSALYLVQWVANGVLTIAGVVFATMGTAIDSLPMWYVLSLAIAPVLWTYLGVTAQQNTPSARDVVEGNAEPPAPERGAIDVGTAVVIGILVVLVLIVLGFIR